MLGLWGESDTACLSVNLQGWVKDTDTRCSLRRAVMELGAARAQRKALSQPWEGGAWVGGATGASGGF